MRKTFSRARLLSIYIGLVGLGGVAAIAYALLHFPTANLDLLLFLLGLTLVAQLEAVPLFGETSISMVYALAFVGLLTFGPEGAIVINLVGSAVHTVYPKRRPWPKAVFNVGALSIVALVAGLVYRAAGGSAPTTDLARDIGPAMAAGVVYFLLNSTMVSFAVSRSTGQGFRQVWVTNHRWLALHYVAVAAMGMAIATAFQQNGLPGVLVFTPALAIPWIATRMFVNKTRELRTRNTQLEQANQGLRTAYDDLARRLAQGRAPHPAGVVAREILPRP